jgi:hypothetical protein
MFFIAFPLRFVRVQKKTVLPGENGPFCSYPALSPDAFHILNNNDSENTGLGDPRNFHVTMLYIHFTEVQSSNLHAVNKP